VSVAEPPLSVGEEIWKSPALLPVFVRVNVSVTFVFGATVWLPPFVSVRVGAFCTTVETVFDVAVSALPLESVYEAVAVFEMVVPAGVCVA
jgi:hypothetical protein